MSDTWLSQLQPASWRGVPFAVRGSEYRRGRRFAVHEYPKRDTPWPEDMGQASRLVGFSGFVVGDDCYRQAQALLDAAEQPGLGQLVHPSLGALTVALIEPLVASERSELGRVVEIRFEFMEGGEPLFPGDAVSTQDAVADKAEGAQAATASDFTASTSGTTPTPATTYTDVNGTTTSIPASSSGIGYQSNVGGEIVSSWSDTAAGQATSAPVLAGGAAGVTPPEGATFGRFDSPGTASFDTPQAAQDAQAANQAAVISAGQEAVTFANFGM